uniref:CONSTANS-like protein n=1 Tax=Pyrus pyrifolia TaxID=3767 RepID=A0A8K1R2C1_PYRPY|nr:CONSTANS-like protein [Pyrus pyrifolia]
MKKLFRACELCDREASFYCPSDSAFLCSRCDARVHQANFLVARHVRHPLCSNCKSVAETPDHHSLCSSCSPEIFSGDGDGDAMSSSSDCSACISSTEMGTTKTGYENPKSEGSVTEVSGSNTQYRFPGAKRNMLCKFSGAKRNYSVRSARARTSRRVDARAEGNFVNWCKNVGVNGNLAAAVVSTASNASGFCLERLAGVPLRVSLAASFWFGLRFRGDRSVSTCQNLRRVEVLSGVPAKLILAVEAKLGSELRIRRARRDDLEEGWAEC